MREELRYGFKQKLLEAGVDVYIACTPANFLYLSGYQSAFIDLSWQMTGTDLVVLPAAQDLPPAMIVSEYCEPDAKLHSDIADIRTYSMWTENRDFEIVTRPGGGIIQRPEQYDPDAILGLVRDVLRGWKLVDPVIGSDLSLMKHGTFNALVRTFPGHRLVDCEQIAYDVRSRKHPGEIANLRNAAKLFDIGVKKTISLVREGQTAFELRSNFENSVREAVAQDPKLGNYEKTFFFPHVGTGDGSVVRRGDIIKLDCGVRINGYWSDGCRHFCLGGPSDEQKLVHRALTAGYQAARDLIRPGSRMGDIYAAALNAVRRNGLPNYSRGHFGHSIGLDDKTEEPPFIGPNDTILRENMVICLEIPFYPPDLGGFNIEDMLLVTATGNEALTKLDLGLVTLQ